MNSFDAPPLAKVHEQVDDVGAEDVENSAAVVMIADPRKTRVIVETDQALALEPNVDKRGTVGADKAV